MAKQDVYLIDIVGKYERLVTIQTLDNMIAKAYDEWTDLDNRDATKAGWLYRCLCLEKKRILARK